MRFPSRQERLAEIYRQLLAAPPAGDAAGAVRMLASIIDRVEDALTMIPNDPESWRNDGRIYPPLPDSERAVEGHPGVRRYRTRGHNVYVGSNGAIEIRRVSGAVELAKPGADGKGVWDG